MMINTLLFAILIIFITHHSWENQSFCGAKCWRGRLASAKPEATYNVGLGDLILGDLWGIIYL